MRVKIKNIKSAKDPDAAQLLMMEMSDISEDHFCAGWLVDLEFRLWKMVQGGDRAFGFSDVAEDKIAELKRLSDKCGGWIMWDGGDELDSGEMFVPLEEWEILYANV